MLSYVIAAVIANLGMILPKISYNILLQAMEEIKFEQKKLGEEWDIKPWPVILHLIILNLQFWHGFQLRHPTQHQLSFLLSARTTS